MANALHLSYTVFMAALQGEFQNRAIIKKSLLLYYVGKLSESGVGVISYSHTIETRLLMNLQTNAGEGMEKVSKEILNGAVHTKSSLWGQNKC